MEDNKKESFVFYRSFLEAIRLMEAEDAKQFVLAMGGFALDSLEPNLNGVLKIVWTTVKPQLEANNRRYENGKRGGAPKGSHNNPNGRRGKSKTETETESPIVSEPNPTHHSAIPTIREVVDYFTAAGLPRKGEEFFHYYESSDWKINENPIFSWKAVANSWISKESPVLPTPLDQKLGVGESRDMNGIRIYGQSQTPVPEDAPPRPGSDYWWNQVTNQWDKAA